MRKLRAMILTTIVTLAVGSISAFAFGPMTAQWGQSGYDSRGYSLGTYATACSNTYWRNRISDQKVTNYDGSPAYSHHWGEEGFGPGGALFEFVGATKKGKAVFHGSTTGTDVNSSYVKTVIPTDLIH